jgi:hypothetical protein
MDDLETMKQLGWSDLELAYVQLKGAKLPEQTKAAVETLMAESLRLHESGKKCHSCAKFTNDRNGSGVGECAEWTAKIHVAVSGNYENGRPYERSICKDFTVSEPRRSEDGCERWKSR